MAEKEKDDFAYDRHQRLELDRAAHNRAAADRLEKQAGEVKGDDEAAIATRTQLHDRAKELRNEAEVIEAMNGGKK